MPLADFEEIAHSGGKLTLKFKIHESGQKEMALRLDHNRAGAAAAWLMVYALPQGYPIAPLKMGGLGQPWSPPPIPGCLPILIGSDSEGMFGHQCPACERIWRSKHGGSFCVYCGYGGQTHDFLTEAQRAYVFEMCRTIGNALSELPPGEHNIVVDFDEVADAIGSEEKPRFYQSNERQQYHFQCEACDDENDILGLNGYCSSCGTRNDYQLFREQKAPAIRANINNNVEDGTCVRDICSAFDSSVRQYVNQLSKNPLTPRRTDLLKRAFHDLSKTHETLLSVFDIDIFKGVKQSDRDKAVRFFHRRHVYEHHGGLVEKKYIDDSDDESVRLGQALREDKGDLHKFLITTLAIIKNLHDGFHSILPPRNEPIEYFQRGKNADSDEC